MSATLCLLIWVVTTPLADAQGLKISSTQPADSSTNVPQNGQIELRFDRPIDTTGRAEDDLPIGAFIGPSGSISIRDHEIDDDGKTLRIAVEQAADTDYTWVVSGATGRDTTSLDAPYVFRYTTASDWGEHAVSGIISWAMTAKRGGAVPFDAVVALLDEPLRYDSSGVPYGFDRIVAAVVHPRYDGSGEYDNEFVISRIRNGTYWPVAFSDTNSNGRIDEGEPFAHYYGSESSIEVRDGDVEDIYLIFSLSGSVDAPGEAAAALMGAIHPNPTNGPAHVEFELEKPAIVDLRLFNMLGQEIRPVIASTWMSAGTHQAIWDTATLSAGTYVCRLKVGDTMEGRLFFVTR